jgi:hypothetical protein
VTYLNPSTTKSSSRVRRYEYTYDLPSASGEIGRDNWSFPTGLEPESARLVAGDLGKENLDRDLAAEPSVARPVDLAHAARPERGYDLVGSEARPGR